LAALAVASQAGLEDGLVDPCVPGSVVLTIATSLAGGLLAVVELAIAPTTWVLVVAGLTLVAGAAAVATAVTRAMFEADETDADRGDGG
jgi:hypothetical protein